MLRARSHLRDLVPLRLGPFTVTPYLVDHSAFDSYAVLVEVAGRRLFYSGDVRAHHLSIRRSMLVAQAGTVCGPALDSTAWFLVATTAV